MCLRFLFLLITRLAAWLLLSRREETCKTAEILILRHQLAVLQRRRRPKLNWADRALLAALLGVIPKARRHGLRLLVTPDTILRWHCDIVRRRWATRSKRGRTGRPATQRNINAADFRNSPLSITGIPQGTSGAEGLGLSLRGCQVGAS
jgi:putative transposase